MKLRNKKTGEIKNYVLVAANSEVNDISLAELNEEWEDCEEPKVAYYIDGQGDVFSFSDTEVDDWHKEKQIGNYFKTKEEAEKVVEKLKAWKRLEDKGFDFEYVEEYKNLCGNGFEIPIIATMPPESYTDNGVSKDLDLLFGGEKK